MGLLVGDTQKTCTGILITIDSIEDVVDEAINKKYNLIVSFHPIIFSGIKKLTGENYVQKTIIKAKKNADQSIIFIAKKNVKNISLSSID